VTDSDLLELAREAATKAYAPYSHFPVGAALIAENGQVFTGCNVENASYGLSRCAEQTTIQKMVSEGVRGFSRIAVYADSGAVTSPCGSCRQILYEFGPDAMVLLGDPAGEITRISVRELIPLAFGPERLEVRST
jgi:cytidine deaminase